LILVLFSALGKVIAIVLEDLEDIRRFVDVGIGGIHHNLFVLFDAALPLVTFREVALAA
jgi:hypothetical protein